MQIQLEIAGGLAALLQPQRYLVETTELPETTRKDLQAIVETVLVEPRPDMNPSLRDARSYELTITQGNKKETITAFDGSVSPTMRKLINLVKSLGRET